MYIVLYSVHDSTGASVFQRRVSCIACNTFKIVFVSCFPLLRDDLFLGGGMINGCLEGRYRDLDPQHARKFDSGTITPRTKKTMQFGFPPRR